MYNLSPALKIAVVDDDDLFRSILEKWLQYHLQSEVLTFTNGKSAWLHLQKPGSADLVISDVDMPLMDGLTLLKQTKESFPAKPVIMISGDPSNAQASLEYGADGFMEKPFSVSGLIQMVNRLAGACDSSTAQQCA